jgi:hypothetical protein
MTRFDAIIAQLQSVEGFIRLDEQRAAERIQFLRNVLHEIAGHAEHKGAGWASERARRALIESADE